MVNGTRGPTWSGCASSARRCASAFNRRLTWPRTIGRVSRIRKKLHRRALKEANFRRNTNHVLSKRIVEQAKDTIRGIALEDLKGFRDRIRFRKPQRARMTGWAFDQLRQFIAYKAQAAGVQVKRISPKHTSQMCSQCGHVERANRLSQSRFVVVAVGTKLMPMSTRLGTSGPGLYVNEPIVSACLPLRRPGEPGTSLLLQGAVVDGQ